MEEKVFSRRSRYAQRNFESRLEALTARALDRNRIHYEYEKYSLVWIKGRRRYRYLPDFYLPALNLFIEVKGSHWQRIDKAFLAHRQLVTDWDEESRASAKSVGFPSNHAPRLLFMTPYGNLFSWHSYYNPNPANRNLPDIQSLISFASSRNFRPDFFSIYRGLLASCVSCDTVNAKFGPGISCIECGSEISAPIEERVLSNLDLYNIQPRRWQATVKKRILRI